MTYLYVNRVLYGKDNVSIEDREYRQGFSPVGNRYEWLALAKDNEYEGVCFIEKDKTKLFLNIQEN